jgi:hypothetical protein
VRRPTDQAQMSPQERRGWALVAFLAISMGFIVGLGWASEAALRALEALRW